MITRTNPSDRWQALSLTGGGYRGLFTASALSTLEDGMGAPIARHFDLTCGTSIGGIIAIAVAFEVPMRRVVEVFDRHGERIFTPHRRPKSNFHVVLDIWKHRRVPRYCSETLRQAISELIDKDATLGDAIHPIAIPAVNLTQGRPQVFKTRHKREWYRDWKLKAVDVAMATAAAPTFFELAMVNGNVYADGGLYANAPDLVALHEAHHFLDVPESAIRMLSVGTTTQSYSISLGAGRQFGIFDWMQGQRLFSVIISAQQQFATQLIEHKLKDRYIRIDHAPSPQQAGDLELDLADKTARGTLQALGAKAMSDAMPRVVQLFGGHQPSTELFRGK